MPSHHTYRRTLAEVIEEEEFESLAREHRRDGGKAGYQVVISTDGKVIRGTIETEPQDGLCLLAVFLPGEGITLAQIAIAHGQNEISVAPTLLDCVDLRNKVVIGLCRDRLRFRYHCCYLVGIRFLARPAKHGLVICVITKLIAWHILRGKHSKHARQRLSLRGIYPSDDGMRSTSHQRFHIGPPRQYHIRSEDCFTFYFGYCIDSWYRLTNIFHVLFARSL